MGMLDTSFLVTRAQRFCGILHIHHVHRNAGVPYPFLWCLYPQLASRWRPRDSSNFHISEGSQARRTSTLRQCSTSTQQAQRGAPRSDLAFHTWN
ncbi:hypothetical protein PISMIDRAFT_688376 [Pisolithus microcarpus 441]|uniref:Uncharacterized protein n=1 Tax=Pisolithus microcarpus 441 TaxID=765257 RepID=A0A0C9XN45_9AGAM|nr:hypothetical protein PISMIDRAFT_688376 [Pisolithus microcarpus 441]